MQRILFLSTCSLLLLLFITSSCASTSLPFTRAMYDGWNASELRVVGFDAWFEPIKAEASRWNGGRGRDIIGEMVQERSGQISSQNVSFILSQKYECKRNVPFDYIRAVNMYGEEEPRVPSPVDEHYWTEHIENFALFAANLSLNYPIWGIVWDMELYHETENWHSSSYTYDHTAFHGFANETGREFPDIPAQDRYRYLKNESLLGEYQDWQEEKLYGMARDTAEKIRTVNPSLSLGIMAIKDAWSVWNITRGFNGSGVPMTIWAEGSYEGYESRKYQERREWWSQSGGEINGVMLPGLWTARLDPFEMIDNMELAIRNDGVLWLYQKHDPFKLADEASYRRAYQLVHEYVFFNQSRADPRDTLTLFPMVEVRPWQGPENFTVLLEAHHLSKAISEGVALFTKSCNLTYVGANLSEIVLEDGDVRLNCLPCLINGVTWNDLMFSQAKSMVLELEILVDSAGWLSLEMPEAETALDAGKNHIDKGELEEAKEILATAIDDGYALMFEQAIPLLDNPPPGRPEPPSGANIKMKVAERLLSEGSRGEANAYVLAGLKEWTTTVGEFDSCVPIIFLLILLALGLPCEAIVKSRDHRSISIGHG